MKAQGGQAPPTETPPLSHQVMAEVESGRWPGAAVPPEAR